MTTTYELLDWINVDKTRMDLLINEPQCYGFAGTEIG